MNKYLDISKWKIIIITDDVGDSYLCALSIKTNKLKTLLQGHRADLNDIMFSMLDDHIHSDLELDIRVLQSYLNERSVGL